MSQVKQPHLNGIAGLLLDLGQAGGFVLKEEALLVGNGEVGALTHLKSWSLTTRRAEDGHKMPLPEDAGTEGVKGKVMLGSFL